MLPGTRIKLADTTDFDALVAVGDRLFDHPVKPQRLREFLDDERHVMAIALRANAAIGMASALTYVHPDKDPAMFINEVGVVDDCQGQGIGTALVRLLCDHARTLGCYEAWVATERENRAARRTYARAGGQLAEDAIVIFSYDLDPAPAGGGNASA